MNHATPSIKPSVTRHVISIRAKAARDADVVLLPENLYKERCRKTAEVLANHLLAEAFPRDEELGGGARSAVEKLAREQVLDTSLRVSAHASTPASKHQLSHTIRLIFPKSTRKNNLRGIGAAVAQMPLYNVYGL